MSFLLCLHLGLTPEARALDGDGDGLSDVWAAKFGVAAGSGAQDPDGDRWDNRMESLLGTDPHDPASGFSMALEPDTSPGAQPGDLVARFQARAGQRYRIQSGTDLAGWQDLGAELPGTDGWIDVALSVGAPEPARGFFRAMLCPPADTDTDELNGWEEAALGCDPQEADTDADGLPDGWEAGHGKSPLNPDENGDGVLDGQEDWDGDYESNADEVAAGHDPQDPASYSDADGDGLPDGFERRYWGDITSENDSGGNPDGDPLTNLEEFELRADPTRAMTDGVHKDGHADRDGDAVIDLWELRDATDPFLWDSDIKTNYVAATAKLERKASWGAIPAFPGWTEEQTYRELMKGTKLILRARGYDTADQSVQSSTGAGLKRGVINVLDTDRAAIRPQGDGYYFAAHLMFLRKGVEYDVELVTTNPNLPFVSGRVYWTPVGTGGFPYSTLNDDEPANRLIFQEVPGRQWYRTGESGTAVEPVRALDPDPDIYNTVFTLIGSASGYGGPGGETSGFSTGQATLLPFDIVPDWNRDGMIDDKDRRRVTAETPWRWWLNDDNDGGDLDGDDVPGGGSNGSDTTVNGRRDLVDFFPLYLDFVQLLNILPPEDYEYRLAHAGVGVNFVCTDLAVADVRAHHHDATLAQQLESASVTKVYVTGLAKLGTGFLNQIKAGEGKGVLLVEAVFAPSDEPLVFEIWRAGTETKVATMPFHLKTSSVEKMYRHLNILSANGQSGGLPSALAEPENLPDSYASSKNFVFVHGYNVNPTQARGWFAEMFKRLWHSGSRAKFTGVTWYGYESQGSLLPDVTPDYQANVLNAFASAQALKDGLQPLQGSITIAGHSLANMLIGSAMEDWGFAASNYFMIDAAVAKECYNESDDQTDLMSDPWWEAYDDALRATEWHNLPWPSDDWRAKLTWKNRLAGVANAHNFYSSGEEVLQNPPHGSAPVPTSAAGVWAAQEKRKGYGLSGWVLTSAYGGWNVNFHPDYVTPLNDPKPMAELTALYGPTGEAAFQNKLMVTPFFNTGFDPLTGTPHPDAPGDIQNLYGSEGSAYASPAQNRNRLLAEMIPARSTAAGSNTIAGISGFDMNANKNGWPSARFNDPGWFHSDIREAAYFFTYKVFDEFVIRGGLNQ